ncbi:hypothetical protein PG990_002823 [Apiospora arundinis]
MAVLKNIIVQGLLAVSVAALPLDSDVSSLDINSVPAPSTLQARKNADKCEAHIAINTSNGLCGNKCTHKYEINIVDKSGAAIGKTYDWSQVGQWGATNPPNKVEIATTKGTNLWLDGELPGGFTDENKWRRAFTLTYGSQVWNSHECANWKHKAPGPSNGMRHQYDYWCEFDC